MDASVVQWQNNSFVNCVSWVRFLPLAFMSKEYTGNNHVIGTTFHMSVGNPSFILRDHDGKEWLCDWHYYFGPTALSKRTGEPLKRFPGERSRFWLIAGWWKEQGGVVVDGVGQWKEP